MSTLANRRLILAALAAAAALPVAAAPAAAAPVTLDGIRTTLNTSPAVTSALVQNAILPLPVGPTRARLFTRPGGVSIAYGFPITAGRVDSETLAGRIHHSGGLRFANLANGRSLSLTRFRIVVSARPGVTAVVNGDRGARVRILNLDLSHAQVTRPLPRVRVAGVRARLTGVAAHALNERLRTHLFTRGLALGTANVLARVAR